MIPLNLSSQYYFIHVHNYYRLLQIYQKYFLAICISSDCSSIGSNGSIGCSDSSIVRNDISSSVDIGSGRSNDIEIISSSNICSNQGQIFL